MNSPKKLGEKFGNKEYAHGYMSELLNVETATQIRILREQRGMTREQLATVADISPQRVAELEDLNFGSWTGATLRKLAYAFDVAVKIAFVPFSQRLVDTSRLTRAALQCQSRTEEIEQGSSPIFSLARDEVTSRAGSASASAANASSMEQAHGLSGSGAASATALREMVYPLNTLPLVATFEQSAGRASHL